MKSTKFWISMLVVLAVAVSAVGVALATNSKPVKHAAKAKVAHVATARHSAATKADGEPSENAAEAASTETDGVDAGGDHQCPPACAPGETP